MCPSSSSMISCLPTSLVLLPTSLFHYSHTSLLWLWDLWGFYLFFYFRTAEDIPPFYQNVVGGDFSFSLPKYAHTCTVHTYVFTHPLDLYLNVTFLRSPFLTYFKSKLYSLKVTFTYLSYHKCTYRSVYMCVREIINV